MKLKEVEGGGMEEEETETEEEAKDSLKKDCLAVCDRLGVKDPDDTFLSLLVHVPAAEREAIVTKYKRNRGVKKPRSGTTATQVRDAAAAPIAEDWDAKLTRIAGLIN